MWATSTDLRDAWLLDPQDLPDDAALTLLIDRAGRYLLSLDPRLQARAQADPGLASLCVDVVVAMAMRVLTNPEGIRSVSETTGPMTRSVTYGGETPGNLFVTEEEKRLLGIRRRQRAFSVPTWNARRR